MFSEALTRVGFRTRGPMLFLTFWVRDHSGFADGWAIADR